MLTTAQLQTLKTAINAETDPAFVVARTNGDTGAMSAFYNVTASPAFSVWRSDYSSDLIAAAIDNGITQLDALTASKRDSLLWWANRSHDARLPQTQAAINDLCGSQNTLKNAVLDGGKRTVTRGERLYCTGSGTNATPGATSYEGEISSTDVVNALGV